MKKLIITKLDGTKITTQVGDHDVEAWVSENKHLFGKDDEYKVTKEAVLNEFGEVVEPEEKELVSPKDWSVEIIDMDKEIEAKHERKKLAKERIKNFDVSKIDNATTIKALREVVKELMVEMIEARE